MSYLQLKSSEQTSGGGVVKTGVMAKFQAFWLKSTQAPGTEFTFFKMESCFA